MFFFSVQTTNKKKNYYILIIGDSLLRKVLKIQSIYDDVKAVSDDEISGESRVPAWMAPLRVTSTEWLNLLPKVLEKKN